MPITSSGELRAPVQEALGSRFQLLEELGPAPGGCIFRAVDADGTTRVALKAFTSAMFPSPEVRDRLVSALRRGLDLQHPHLAPPLAISEHDAFVCCSLMLGRDSLENVMRSGTVLPTGRILGIVQAVASALDYVHEKGSVHGGVKPSNILFDEKGQVWLVDIGVERALSVPGSAYTTAARSAQAYHSPELRYQRRIDGRADQYSLAVITYELLTGQRRLDSPVIAGIQTVAPLEVPADVPLRRDVGPHVNAALRKALSASPMARFASAGVFAQALSASAEPTTTPRRRSGRRALLRPAYFLPAAIGAAAVIAVLTLGGEAGKARAFQIWETLRRDLAATPHLSEDVPPSALPYSAPFGRREEPRPPQDGDRSADRPMAGNAGGAPRARGEPRIEPGSTSRALDGSSIHGPVGSRAPSLSPSSPPTSTEPSAVVPAFGTIRLPASTDAGSAARNSVIARVASWFGFKRSAAGTDASPNSQPSVMSGAPAVDGAPSRLPSLRATDGAESKLGPAYIEVTVDAGSAIAIIDGVPRGTTPVTASVGAGSHTVSVRSITASYEPAQSTVSVADGSTTSAAFHRAEQKAAP